MWNPIKLRNGWQNHPKRCARARCKSPSDVIDSTQHQHAVDIPLCTPCYVLSSDSWHEAHPKPKLAAMTKKELRSECTLRGVAWDKRWSEGKLLQQLGA